MMMEIAQRIFSMNSMQGVSSGKSGWCTVSVACTSLIPSLSHPTNQRNQMNQRKLNQANLCNQGNRGAGETKGTREPGEPGGAGEPEEPGEPGEQGEPMQRGNPGSREPAEPGAPEAPGATGNQRNPVNQGKEPKEPIGPVDPVEPTGLVAPRSPKNLQNQWNLQNHWIPRENSNESREAPWWFFDNPWNQWVSNLKFQKNFSRRPVSDRNTFIDTEVCSLRHFNVLFKALSVSIIMHATWFLLHCPNNVSSAT